MIKKNILVCPLDWGLGHATRMVPVIDMLTKKGANVIIAADNNALSFLKQRFPNNKFVKLPGYTPNYPVKGSMGIAIIRSMPAMIKSAKKAKKQLKDIIDKYNIDAVISDNRYELSTKKMPCIFITHQLNIQTNGLEIIAKPFINRLLRYYLNKFNEIWVPDTIDDFNLSGILSKSKKYKNKKYNIGLLSRFSKKHVINVCKTIDVLIILSGPEPQRTILEQKLLKQALKTDLKITILLAKPNIRTDVSTKNVRVISHLNDIEFANIINLAKVIICRPGYSTLMDLAVFNKSAIFIPTPGQTEQEYLANRLLKMQVCFSQPQNKFNLTEAIKEQAKYTGLKIDNNNNLLEDRVISLINRTMKTT